MSAQIIGDPGAADIWVVVDHASAALPQDVDLGLPPELMQQHIALDIGVAEIAKILAREPGHAAILAPFSRLLVDLNRSPEDPAVIPECSDGIEIPANRLSDEERQARIARYHRAYHAELDRLIAASRPAFILFLHSFTPQLSDGSDAKRPWELGLLYNRDRRGADIAMDYFTAEGFCVGDQQPYSGLIYNYAFVRHGEKRGIAQLLLEIRQDLIDGPQGHGRFADHCRALIAIVRERLA